MPGHWIETVPRAYGARPPQGSGPGLLLCTGETHIGAATRSMAEMWGEEGYTVLAIPQGADLAAALRTLRNQPTCKGKLAVLGNKDGDLLALQAAAARLVEAVVLIEPQNPIGAVAEIGDLPALLHVANRTDVVSPTNGKTYSYADAAPGFTITDDPAFNRAAAGMVYSRTLAFLRAELGPHYDLDALWEVHRACEFITRDADATMRTMVAEPYVNHVPTMTGGFGQMDLHRFYRDHFIPNNPTDMRNIPISRTVGADRVVNEGILCFTHDRQIDWLLPGVPPTGKYVEVALIGIITFRGDKLIHEHIYWDQASVLVQIGLLDPTGLPVAGAAAARKVMNPSLPSNELLPGWVPRTVGVLPVRTQLDALLSHLERVEGLRILDIGCGEGALGRELAQCGAVVTGIDPHMEEQPWQSFGTGRFRIVRAAAEDLPLQDASIDVGLFIYSLHHMPKLAEALREVRRVLRPTGKLYVAEPLAEGDCNAVVSLFHDESEVRREAAAILHRVAAPMFARHVTETYAERRVIADFDAFAERMIANRRFNGYSAEAVLAPSVRAKYAEVAGRTDGVFDQPVRIDLYQASR